MSDPPIATAPSQYDSASWLAGYSDGYAGLVTWAYEDMSERGPGLDRTSYAHGYIQGKAVEGAQNYERQ